MFSTPHAPNNCLVWLVLACERKREHRELIEQLYDYVDIDMLRRIDTTFKIFGFFRFYNKNKQNFIRALTEMKEDLIKRKGGLDKFENIENFFVAIEEFKGFVRILQPDGTDRVEPVFRRISSRRG